jgi:hypothetical protein
MCALLRFARAGIFCRSESTAGNGLLFRWSYGKRVRMEREFGEALVEKLLKIALTRQIV